MSFERPTGTQLFIASISSSNAAFLDGSTVPLAEYASAATILPTGTQLFVASISSSNAAFLDGSTVPLAEYASAATTLPLDIDLWHRRLAHHHLAGVRMLLDHKLVTGMHLDSKSAPDPICEPCLAGKMHSNPFPATRPLELVHSDVHQVPYPSFSGFRYWVTFIDDYSRYRFVLPIKAKSDVFEAFKQFKAYAENQSERKIMILRDDKGGVLPSVALRGNTLSGHGLSRMVLQRELIGYCLSISPQC